MLTVNQVAEKLHTYRKDVIWAIESGELYAIEVNGRYMVDPAWLEEYTQRRLREYRGW